jgi:hypothetical protein
MTSDESTTNLQLFQHYDEKGVLNIDSEQTIDLCYIQEGSLNHTTYKSKGPTFYSTIRVFTIVETNGSMYTMRGFILGRLRFSDILTNWVVVLSGGKKKTLWALYANSIDERELPDREEMVDEDSPSYATMENIFGQGVVLVKLLYGPDLKKCVCHQSYRSPVPITGVSSWSSTWDSYYP